MRVELKNTQGAAALSMHLLRIQLLVLLNDELLIVMCPERIFLASETSTCIHQRSLSFRRHHLTHPALRTVPSQVLPYWAPSAPAGKNCGKQLAAPYSSSPKGALATRCCRFQSFRFGCAGPSLCCSYVQGRLERERKEKEAAAMAAAGIKGKRR